MLIPALGGKIRDVTLAGRQWFWHNADIPVARPARGDSYALAGDSGGLDECFPTIAACRVPAWVRGAGDLELPDHGELWSQEPDVTILTDEEGHSATCVWTGRALPYRFTRTIAVRPEGALSFAYAVVNTGPHRVPFVWSSNPLFPLSARTRLVLPEGARARLWAQRGVDFGRPGSEHQWPWLRAGGALVDLSRPGTALRDGFACKLFVDLPRAEALIALEEDGVRLEMRIHGREIPRVGVWINRRGWTPFRGRRSRVPFLRRKPTPYSNVALQPCIGAPDALSDALGEWDAAHWLEPGATARWSMTWRARRVADAA